MADEPDLSYLDDGEALGDVAAVEPEERRYEPAPRGLPEVIDVGGGEKITAEVVVGGQPFSLLAKPPSCTHQLAYTQQVVMARLVDEHGALIGFRAQLKMRCGECGTPFRFRPLPNSGTVDVDLQNRRDNRADASTSDDRLTVGIICDPVPDDERGDEWAAIGGTQDMGVQVVSPPLRSITGA